MLRPPSLVPPPLGSPKSSARPSASLPLAPPSPPPATPPPPPALPLFSAPPPIPPLRNPALSAGPAFSGSLSAGPALAASSSEAPPSPSAPLASLSAHPVQSEPLLVSLSLVLAPRGPSSPPDPPYMHVSFHQPCLLCTFPDYWGLAFPRQPRLRPSVLSEWCGDLALDLGRPCFQEPLASWESHAVAEFDRPSLLLMKEACLRCLEEGLKLSPLLLEGQAGLSGAEQYLSPQEPLASSVAESWLQPLPFELLGISRILSGPFF